MSLGAAEYLQKDLATPDVLLETVRRVAQQLKRERLRNSDGEAHADTAPQLRTEYLNLLLSGTAENLRTAPYQLEKWGLLKRGAPFTVGLLTVQMPDTGSQRAQPPYAGIIAIAQEIFCREGSSCFFRTAGRNIAALLPALSPERMEKAFSRLQSMAESSIDCILSMGISETANDARQIPALYEHAHQACASAYYDGHGKLYRFSASPARHTAGRPAYKRTNTFSAAALHAELDALTVHLKNARPQLPHAAAQLTAFIQRTILLAEQTGIIAGADEVSGDEIAKSCASAAELSLAAAGIHRLIDVLDARRSQSQPDILLRQITEYVQTHLCGKIRLEDIAQEVYMSPSYVSRFFKQATGMNLSGYIRAQKIEKAKQLLRLYPVGEVSAQLGYTSVSHFVSIFSEETGLTPYRFKRQSQPDGQKMP